MDYHLSIEVDKDLEDIFDYTLLNYGDKQAFDYVSSFDAFFELICDEPQLGRERNEIRKGLRSITKKSHIVFYRIMENEIRIVRILHGSRDVPPHF